MSLPFSNTAPSSGPARRVIAQVITRLDEGTVDGVINHLRQVGKDPTLLETLDCSTAPLFDLLEEVPPDDRAAACLTAVSLLSGQPEHAIRWARWWVCIAMSDGHRNFEAGLWLALAHWCCGNVLQAGQDLAELTGSEAPVSQTRFALALAFLILGETEHLTSYQQAIAAEDPPLAELLSILQRSMGSGRDPIATGKDWAIEWCAGRLLWFVASSIFAPAVVTPAAGS